MKALKRFGAALVTLLALTALLTGTALAAGPGDGITVQLNGEPVTFTDAFPEFSGGRTFVPLRAVTEAMGAQVDYNGQAKTVTIRRGGVDLFMALGERQATVTEDGESRVVTMDVSPYFKHQRTYVPVRFMAEAFGCNVGWDQENKTAIIVDVDALLGDATFDLMDNFAAYCKKHQTSDNMSMTGKLDLELTDKTGIDLPGPISAKGSIDGVTGDKGAQMNWKLDLADLASLIGAEAPTHLVQGIRPALSDLEGEIRVDLDSAMLYLTMPPILTGGAEGAWYSLDLGAYETQLLGGLDMNKLAQLEEAGIREALTEILRCMPVDDSLTGYATLAQMASLYADLLGDQAFTQKGSTYVAQTKLEDMVDMTVTLTKKGDDITAADIKMSCDVDEDGDKVTMTMTEHAAPDKVTVTMDMEVSDSAMSVKLNLDLSCVPTRKAPVVTLPAGVQAVPLD